MRYFGRFITGFILSLFVITSAKGAGILAPTDVTLPPLRVTDHHVTVSVQDQIALTTLQQTFHNDTSRRLEATYVFPLPENADLTDFQMSFNGKMVKGKVLPADEARQIYESIVRQTRDPGLIEFIGRRLLQMRVFPIEPGSDTKIEVKYQQVCRPMSGMNAYHYPLRTAKAAGRAYGTVRFNLNLSTTAPLKNIWSPTHAVEIVRDGEYAAKIAYEVSGGSLDDDFLLLYDNDASDLGLSVIAYKPDESKPGHFVLTMTPKQLWPRQEYQPQDVVFVIDTSGSMSGEKIEQAKSSLKYCIDKLDAQDQFTIVRFSTGYDSVFDSLVKATNENRASARKKIDTYSASGGTNIHDTLRHVLDLRPKAGGDAESRPFVVVFITDGQGNRNANEILAMVKAHGSSAATRMFPFGVGHDVNTVLLDQLAVNYSGKPTYVQPGENLELVLGDFFSVISQPVLTNLKLTLPEINATEKFPAELGDLYHGQQLILAGQFSSTATGPIKLTARRNNQEVEYVWPKASFTHTVEATYVPGIWAGRKIAYLIDQIRAHGEKEEMVAEIIALSQQYGIQTPYTSWLVNPERQLELARAVRNLPATSAPARGFGRALESRLSQTNALREQGIGGIDDSIISPDMQQDLDVAEEAMAKSTGADATQLAAQNAQFRNMQARDGGRLDQNILLQRNISDRWYNQIGSVLVDEDLDADTEILKVNFGSLAYFELVQRRADLRPALAATQQVAVMVQPRQAVLVVLDDGINEFSSEQLELIGPVVR